MIKLAPPSMGVAVGGATGGGKICALAIIVIKQSADKI